MKAPFIKFNTIKIKIKKILWFLGSYPFLVILSLILISLVIGILLSYQYVILSKTSNQQSLTGAIKFDYSGYQKVLRHWQTKKQVSQESPNTGYSNPFTPI